MILDSVTVGFSTTSKWLSRLIRLFTKSRVSHAWIGYYDETLDKRMVMQAEAWGYEVRPWSRWMKQNRRVAEFIVPSPERARAALRGISAFLGVKYDYTAALWLAVKRWWGRFLKRPHHDPGKLMCSEAVVRFLQLGGYPVAADLDPETTSPGELLIRVEQDPTFTQLPPSGVN